MKKLLLGFFLVLQGCSDIHEEVASKCSASGNFECYELRLDAAIDIVEKTLEFIDDNEDEFIDCLGEEKYEELLKIADDSIEFYENQKFSFFHTPKGYPRLGLLFNEPSGEMEHSGWRINKDYKITRIFSRMKKTCE